MLLRILGFCLAGLATARLSAEDVLFVSSDPMGARIFLDGQELAGPTPSLIRALPAGAHVLRVEKGGYWPQEARIETPTQISADFRLSPSEAMLHFEGEPAVRVGGRLVEPADGVIGFRSGSLALEAKRDEMTVTPIFGGQRLLDGIRFALPLFIGVAGVLTAREIFAPRPSPFVIAPELAASALIGGGLLGWDIALELRRKAFLERYRVEAREAGSLAIAARLRFEAADAELSRGAFDSARARFEAIARDYPESPIAARALFQGATLDYVAGDRRAAKEAFGRIVRDYPLLELYDRSLKGLADCLVAEGDVPGAVARLELLTYRGPGLSRDEVELYRRALASPEPLSSEPAQAGGEDQGALEGSLSDAGPSSPRPGSDDRGTSP
jgi:hypothetical protein